MNTKIFAFAAIFALVATTTLNAQSSYKMGFTLGSNYSSLKSDMFTTASGRLSAAAGFTISLGFGDQFELTPEIMFVQKGASAKVVDFQPESQSEVSTYDFYYNSFEVGVFAGFESLHRDEGGTSTYIEVGFFESSGKLYLVDQLIL